MLTSDVYYSLNNVKSELGFHLMFSPGWGLGWTFNAVVSRLDRREGAMHRLVLLYSACQRWC